MAPSFKSDKYPNLYRRPGHNGWVFRKYASAKRKEFVYTTGLENESQAYKAGCKKFQDWMASVVPTGRGATIRGIALAIIAENRGRENTVRSKNRHLRDHVIPGFGHLKPEQITANHWRRYDSGERAKGRNSLYNDKKYLIECLSRAVEAKLIPSLPKLPNFDPDAEPPRPLSYKEYRWLRHELPCRVNLLVFVMYWQGARPGEILRYRWDMINWDTREISIPGSITKTKRNRTIYLNPRVYRALNWLRSRAKSDWIFPSSRYANKPMYAYSAAWGLAIEALRKKKRPHDFHMYCLRDTYITRMIKEGCPTTFVGKYCDTSGREIEKRYCGSDEEAMKRVAGYGHAYGRRK